MKHSTFALFVDVMGVQKDLLPTNDRKSAEDAFLRCRERLESFHQDLSEILSRELPLLMMNDAGLPPPSFIAEFSDAAYIVGERFGSVAIPALFLMRRALRHEYPLRGGIGVGSFSHENSGVRTDREQQVWTTSSFLGGAVVTAYQAERSNVPGLRIFVHPTVLQRNTEGFLKPYTVSLPESEKSADSTHELRFWRATEAPSATARIQAFRDKQTLAERAVRHYDATVRAYERFGTITAELPHALPALWL